MNLSSNVYIHSALYNRLAGSAPISCTKFKLHWGTCPYCIKGGRPCWMKCKQLTGSWWLQGATQSNNTPETDMRLGKQFLVHCAYAPRPNQHTAVCTCRVTAGVSNNEAEGAGERGKCTIKDTGVLADTCACSCLCLATHVATSMLQANAGCSAQPSCHVGKHVQPCGRRTATGC
jgi:hypothetical protein